MMARIPKSGLLLLLVGVTAGAIAWLRRDNERQRRHAAELRRETGQIVRQRETNARTRELLARAAEDGGSAARAIHAEVEKVRHEIADLEKRGDDQRAQAAPDTAKLTANRDPEKGLMLMENFQNAGRATPSAAFQTLVWAAMKSDDQAVASLLSFDAAAREQAQAMLAALPEEVRAKYPTPEDLAALFMSNLITGHSAACVVAQDMGDVQHATVTVAFDGMSGGRPLPMRLGAGGWQLAVTSAMLPEFQRQLRGEPTIAPKK